MKTIKELRDHPGFRITIAALYGFCGWLNMITGWAYLPWTTGPDELPEALKFATQFWPVDVYGWMWVASGLFGIVTAFMQLRRRWFAWSLSAMITMHLLWFAFYAYVYFNGDHRAYLTSVGYLRPVALMVIIAVLVIVLRPTPIKPTKDKM